MAYNLYFEHNSVDSLDCADLATNIRNYLKLEKTAENDSGSGDSDNDDNASGSDSDIELLTPVDEQMEAAVAAMSIDDLWKTAGELQWGMKDDGAFSEATIRQRATTARRSKGFRPAVRRLTQELLAEFPELAAEPNDVVVELIAFGREVAQTAGRSPGFLLYAKNQMQRAGDVTLAQLLNV